MIYLSIGLICCCALFVSLKHKTQPLVEKIIKILGSGFFSIYIVYFIKQQWVQYERAPHRFSFFSWLNWSLVLGLFVLYIVSYLIREPAKVRANRLREIILPLACSVLPFVIIESPRWFYVSWLKEFGPIRYILKPFYVQTPGNWNAFSILCIIFGSALTLFAMMALKKSFSIFTEVRTPVYTGVYRYFRHPMYVGEVLTTIGLCFLTPSYINIVAVVLFVFLITLRAHNESEKIRGFYPEYNDKKPKIF